MKSDRIEEIYRTLSAEEIPWNRESPPDILVKLIEEGSIKSCNCIDLGCGIGHYAIYLSTRGFSVTGVDASSTAIKLARENAKRKGADCRFIAADVLSPLARIDEIFDFAYDWEVLHHIEPKKRGIYIQNLVRLLNPGGKHLSVSFSEKDPHFGGKGKCRKTPLETVLYFSTLEELEKLFTPHFRILESRIIEVPGKMSPHKANYLFLKKSL